MTLSRTNVYRLLDLSCSVDKIRFEQKPFCLLNSLFRNFNDILHFSYHFSMQWQLTSNVFWWYVTKCFADMLSKSQKWISNNPVFFLFFLNKHILWNHAREMGTGQWYEYLDCQLKMCVLWTILWESKELWMLFPSHWASLWYDSGWLHHAGQANLTDRQAAVMAHFGIKVFMKTHFIFLFDCERMQCSPIHIFVVVILSLVKICLK